MKKLNIKNLFVFLCMIFGFSGNAKCQIYSDDDCFYARAGSSSVSYVVKFEYIEDRVWLKSVSHSTVRSKLAKSENYYENEVWTNGQGGVTMWQYDSQKSTSSREVYYRKKFTQQTNMFGMPYDMYGNYLPSVHSGYEYVAFSKDKSSFIKWSEPLNNYEGKINNKITYTRIPKEDLLPKAANYDFLDD